ncbi:sigma-70 family RNA polymerase sigma factor [Rhodobacteraceae bacterium RKSG542]|uniref:sigma-70 family RNA polymerase sigma factor n=1 Tax=Pseudovibrio flavus TaxID=2529854 RepID=UPI0012BC8051|nr:sigma-70 family RNA polymerase sigma factor [Pseudovibrio flavus]MTI16289.1 sigma-70 family RNA polymerase sigma factor [Pseudovibrio flavus]
MGLDPRKLSAHLVSVGECSDRSAFKALFDHFAPRLKSFYIRSGSSEPFAEELVQETFMSIWRKAGLYDPAKAAASTWIFTIARNLRIDRLRKEGRFVQKEEFFFEQAMVEEGDQEAYVDQGVIGEAVEVALTQLPSNQAEVIKLSFYEHATHAEIASRLQLPLGTVKSRLRLAFGRLRTLLADLEQ